MILVHYNKQFPKHIIISQAYPILFRDYTLVCLNKFYAATFFHMPMFYSYIKLIVLEK